MLDLMLGLNRSCDRVTRRDLAASGFAGSLGLTLPSLLGGRARASAERSAGEVSCILLWLQGGISHIDSFDPKPEAPQEIRGEFGAIATNVPGIMVLRPASQAGAAPGQVLDPPLAQPAQRVARRGRRLHADWSSVQPGADLSGVRRGGRQGEGRPQRRCLPTFSSGTSIDKKFGGGVAGFLGDQYNPFILPGDASSPNFTVRDVVLPGGVDRDRFQHRMKVLHAVDTWQSADGERARARLRCRRPARFTRRPITWSPPRRPRRRSTFTSEDPAAARPLRAEFAGPGLLAGAALDRGGRPVRHRHRRRLGHPPE